MSTRACEFFTAIGSVLESGIGYVAESMSIESYIE